MSYPLESYRSYWQDRIYNLFHQRYSATSLPARAADLAIGIPPEGHGELAIALFPLAKGLRRNPVELAAELAQQLGDAESSARWGRTEAQGPYLNIHLPRQRFSDELLHSIAAHGKHYGNNSQYAGQRIMVEFSSPNTNKPLHLGHLRNNVLGAVIANLLEACGAEVRRVNLINNRGIHICKSMAAYIRFGNAATPASAGRKADHFVGDWYVRYNQWEKHDPQALGEARNLLRRWEKHDPQVYALWERMNSWAEQGMRHTYRATGITFDDWDYESNTYLRGKEEILRHKDGQLLEQGDDGSLWIDLQDVGLDRKVLLRADGTSLYVTQDIGTIIARYERWPFDRHIYVVASEQQYHFKVLFEILRRMGYRWTASLAHRSYGMVYLPEGKMKSREGTVVDADDLLDTLSALIRQEIVARAEQREMRESDIDALGHKIAVAALHYWLLQIEPQKDVSFDTQRSISFTGNSGAYILYVGARIASVLREATRQGLKASPDIEQLQIELLNDPLEWNLIYTIADFPLVIARSAASMDPSRITGYLYRLAKLFSQYYHKLPIVNVKETPQSEARLALCNSLLTTLRRGCELLLMPMVSQM